MSRISFSLISRLGWLLKREKSSMTPLNGEERKIFASNMATSMPR
jgi:hypothetical protein